MKIKKGTIIIDLNKDEKLLWDNVQKDNRWSVNKARKNGIIIKDDGNKDKCYDLYLIMNQKNRLLPLKKEDIFSKGKLFTAWKENSIVAFSIIEEEKNHALLRINASDYAFRNTQANSLLYWEIIIYCKRKGLESLDLGGLDLHSNYSKGRDIFKERWGGRLIEKTQEVSLPEYIWWRWLRHSKLLRNLKYFIQTKILKKGSSLLYNNKKLRLEK